MADADLDDFFAKKDKSKKKSKSKFTASDILEKKDQPAKKTKKKKEKKEQSQTTDSVTPSSAKPGGDDEWEDYEPEEEKDYTGLRIQTLQISSKEGEGNDEKENDDNLGSDDEDGENKQKKESQQGPWKQSGQTAPARQPTPPPEPEETVKEETPEPAPKNVGKYIPPSRRAAMEAGPTSASMGAGPPRRKKEAPNIQSEFDFPTLGGEPMAQGSVSPNSQFERVKGGGKQADDPSRQQQKLELGNKFDALTSAD